MPNASPIRKQAEDQGKTVRRVLQHSSNHTKPKYLQRDDDKTGNKDQNAPLPNASLRQSGFSRDNTPSQTQILAAYESPKREGAPPLQLTS